MKRGRSPSPRRGADAARRRSRSRERSEEQYGRDGRYDDGRGAERHRSYEASDDRRRRQEDDRRHSPPRGRNNDREGYRRGNDDDRDRNRAYYYDNDERRVLHHSDSRQHQDSALDARAPGDGTRATSAAPPVDVRSVLAAATLNSGAGAVLDNSVLQPPEGEQEEDPEAAMAAMLGFSSFDTTKGKAVADNQVGPAKGASKTVTHRKYRQYMNRVGGFNRSLDAIK